MSSSSAARHGRSTDFFPRLTSVARAAVALLGAAARHLPFLPALPWLDQDVPAVRAVRARREPGGTSQGA